MTDKQRKKIKAAYMKSSYQRKQQEKKGLKLSPGTYQVSAGFNSSAASSSFVLKPDPVLTISFKGWKLEGIGPLSDIEKILLQLKGK